MQTVLNEQFFAGPSVVADHGRIDVDELQPRVGSGMGVDERIRGAHFFDEVPTRETWLDRYIGDACIRERVVYEVEEGLGVLEDLLGVFAGGNVIVACVENDETRRVGDRDPVCELDTVDGL